MAKKTVKKKAGKKKVALVTGGAGFIGSHIVDALVQKGFKVVIVDDLSSGSVDNVNPKADLYQMDIRNPQVSAIFQKYKPQFVFHLAAQINLRKSLENPMLDAEINIIGALNILKHAHDYGVKKFVFTSSGGGIYYKPKSYDCKEEGDYIPDSGYGVAKQAFEKYLAFYKEKYDFDYVALRPGNVYGPRQDSRGEAGIVSVFTCALLSGEIPVIHGRGSQTRDYVHVLDVVKANMLAMKKEAQGIFNVGTGKETSVNKVFKLIADTLHYGGAVERDLKADFGKKRNSVNISKIRRKLGWKPTIDVEQGIPETVEWFVENKKSMSCSSMLCAHCYEGV